MLAIRQPESDTSISARFDMIVGTNADTEAPISRRIGRNRDSRDAWQSLIDAKLSSWLADPLQLADEGVQPPTGTIIRLALDYAEKLRDSELPPPNSVVVDANGGVLFERRENEISEVIHFWDDGAVEYQLFDRTHLIERRPY